MVHIDRDSEDYNDYPSYLKVRSTKALVDKGVLAKSKVAFYEIQELPMTLADHELFSSPKDLQMADMNTQFKDLEKQVTDSAVLNDSVAKLNSDMDVLMALVDGADQSPAKRVYKR